IAPIVPPITWPISPPPAGGEPVPPCARIPITSPYHETRNHVVVGTPSPPRTGYQCPASAAFNPRVSPSSSPAAAGHRAVLSARSNAARPIDPSSRAVMRPSRPTTNSQGSVGRLNCLNGSRNPLLGLLSL